LIVRPCNCPSPDRYSEPRVSLCPVAAFAAPVPPAQAPPPPIGPPAGLHVAIGTIDYGGGQTGYLVYIKSSLTGDENDYIRDYARRNSRFPHEFTGDQFFTEEQFEVYRALGFHMVHGVLSGHDVVCVAGAAAGAQVRFSAAETNPIVTALRRLLMC